MREEQCGCLSSTGLLSGLDSRGKERRGGEKERIGVGWRSEEKSGGRGGEEKDWRGEKEGRSEGKESDGK